MFTFLLLTGFWAHFTVPPEQLVDATSGAFRQDLVMTVYLQNAFPDWVFTIISVVLLAAAMSTLDGLLVGISTITANDLVLNVIDKFGKGHLSREEQMKLAFRASHVVLIVIAVLVFFVNLNPSGVAGHLWAGRCLWVGAGGGASAAGRRVVHQSPDQSGLDLFSAGHWHALFLLYFFGETLFPGSNIAFANPGATATLGILIGLTPALLGGWWINRREPSS